MRKKKILLSQIVKNMCQCEHICEAFLPALEGVLASLQICC